MGVDLKHTPQLHTAAALRSHSALVQTGDWFYAMADPDMNASFIPELEKRGAARIVAQKNCKLETKIPVINVQNVRLQYLIDCSVYYASLFNSFKAFGVTGTKGKTSIAYGLHSFFLLLGLPSVYIGTLGVCYGRGLQQNSNTTPGLFQLIEILQEAKRRGINQICMEISSQGLEQHRVPCQIFDQRAFTDLSPEHLDAHKTIENYFHAKSQFFNPNYPIDGQKFEFYCLDRSLYSKDLEKISGQSALDYGLKNNQSFTISEPDYALGKVSFTLTDGTGSYDFEFPWMGFFNVENLTLIIQIALSKGFSLANLQMLSPSLGTVPGRMEEVRGHPSGRVFVDYAHSSEALEFVCKSTRPLVKNRMIVLFGCGGDRDPSKRSAMGKAAATYADLIVLTDDNPRFEDSNEIINQIHEGIPENQSVLTIKKKKKAIITAVSNLDVGDVLLVCGKGHESTMTVGEETWYSDDRQIIKEVLGDIRLKQVHSLSELLEVPGARLIQKGSARGCNGFHFDSRLIKPDFAFVAMEGESRDGHNFIDAAVLNGASLVILQKPVELDIKGLTVIQHPHPLEFLKVAASNYRNSHPASFVGITGSVGKTTCKDALLHFMGSDAYGSPGNFNNTLGLPLSILNMPPNKRFAIFEMGISKPGEMEQLVNCLNPDVMIFLPVYGSHEGNFESREHLLNEKLLASKLLSENDPIFVQKTEYSEIVSILNREVSPLDFTTTDLNRFGRGPANSIGFAREIAICLGVSKQDVADRLEDLQLSPLRMEIRSKGAWTFLLDCYNAAPESTNLFLESIELPSESIVVLADMLELGEYSQKEHENLLRLALEKKFSRLYLLGPLYGLAWKSLQSEFLSANCSSFDEKNDLESELLAQSPSFLALKGSRFFALETLVDSLGDS